VKIDNRRIEWNALIESADVHSERGRNHMTTPERRLGGAKDRVAAKKRWQAHVRKHACGAIPITHE
jgi:hypothetical protein